MNSIADAGTDEVPQALKLKDNISQNHTMEDKIVHLLHHNHERTYKLYCLEVRNGAIARVLATTLATLARERLTRRTRRENAGMLPPIRRQRLLSRAFMTLKAARITRMTIRRSSPQQSLTHADADLVLIRSQNRIKTR